MKHFIFNFLTLALAFFAISPPLKAQTPPVPVGEKLTYNVSFASFTDAAYVELYSAGREKLGEREVYAVRAKVRTTGAVQASLLDLNNDYTTLLAVENGLPVRAERFVRDDEKDAESSRDFAENQTVSELNLHDVISAVYQLRRIELNEKTATSIKIWDNEKIYDAKFQIVGRETLPSSLGAVNTLIVQVKTKDDVFNRYHVKIYLSDDERKLPVLITAKLPQGLIRADLSSVQIVAPQPVPVVQPTPPVTTPTPIVRPTPRPSPTPKPYVDNQPLDPALPFALGEKLTFDVLRGEQKVGTVTMAVKDRKQHFGRDSVLLSITAGGGSSLFNPNDKIESYIDPNSIVPLRHEINLNGVLNGFNQLLEFDQQNGFATTGKAARVEIPVGTYDVLSFIYALRAFNYSFARKPQGDFQGTKASLFLGDAPQILTLTPVRETIDFNNQKVKTIALTTQTGNPQIDSLGLKLWLSDDARRLPLKLTLNSPQGAIQAVLIAYQ